MKLTISQASRTTGVARGTLYAHIKKGRLSAEPDEFGRIYVQVAELERVYGTLKNPKASTLSIEQSGVNTEQSQSVNVDAGQQALVEALRRENELLRSQLMQANQEKLGLLDVLKSQTRLLQAPTDAQAEGKRRRRWWHR